MKPRFFPSAARFRAWLERHHAGRKELLVGYWKRHTGRPSLTWPESVDEAICFGWIDGVRRSLDAERYTIRFTPRRPGSRWSAVNRRKAMALLAAGRMRSAGRRAWEARPDGEDAGASYERPAARLPVAMRRAFEADGPAWARFAERPPWYRRTALHWVLGAKREATRARRLSLLIEASARGRAIPPLAGSERPARGSRP